MEETQISIKQIKEFSKIYNLDSTNKLIENSITECGLESACIDREIIIQNQPIFNIELPESKRYDQKNSGLCWVYAGFNVIKYDISRNLNIDVSEFSLSSNYIEFFDKLEKSNNTYENIINLNNINFSNIHKEYIMEFCVSEGGYWEWFVAIINKYGIVPSTYMKSAFENYDYEKITSIYKEKVKKDVIELLELKRQAVCFTKLRETKNRYLQENYILLSKILGEPISKFDYEYKNKNDEYKKYENITPLEFKNKFLALDIENFVAIGNIPMYNKEYYKVYEKKYLGNVYGKSSVRYLNLPICDLKELAIRQLKNNNSVYIYSNMSKFVDKNTGILDNRLYNYDKTLNLEKMSKEEALNLYDISAEHAMTITGVNIIDGKTQRWKVEDSYGDKEKLNGCYIMNDNFFDEFVLGIVIDKKYLSNEQIELLLQEPIEVEIKEPF